MRRKLIPLDLSEHLENEIIGTVAKQIDGSASGLTGPLMCEVICYFPFNLSYRRNVSIKSNVFGHVIGKAGATMTMIQQVSGTRLTVSRQPDRNSNDKNLKEWGVFLVEADTPNKIDVAAAMMRKATQREYNTMLRK
jgi:hypothetical protein